MKKTIFLMLCAIAVSLTTMAQHVLHSPDGKYKFTFTQQDGTLSYQLDYDNKPVVEQGNLGVAIDNHLVEQAMGIPMDTSSVWTKGMTLTGVERTTRDTTWTPPYGESATVRDHYCEMTLHFVKGNTQGGTTDGYNKRQQYLLDIIVRAYDEGVAIRYHFPEATNGLFMHITDDLTSFRFAPGAVAYHAAWAQAQYRTTRLLTSEQTWQEESERPLVLRLANGLYTALGEADNHDFVRGKLRLAADNTLQMSLYDSADIITAYSMPWRVIMVGERATDLINHNALFLNLNAPSRIADTSWLKPGKCFRSDLTDQALKASIDFAAERHFQYVLLDARWYGPEMEMSSSALRVDASKDFSIPEIVAYGREKGIGIWLYVNQRALYQQLDSILPLYEQWGVKGIKFGFVQVGSQQWTTWLHEAIAKCAAHHLLVDIHDEYRPTGYQRTYPNLLTAEGVGGNEEMPTATHNVTLPFTRFLCGPADYTLCYYNSRKQTTYAHQLAMAAVYYSPLTLMYWYDKPSYYRGEAESEFWEHIPTVWDESQALQGEPGEYIVTARRSGADWFVGAMTGDQQRTVSLPLSFLPKGKKYVAHIYEDDPTLQTRTHVRSTTRTVTARTMLSLPLQKAGGAAIWLEAK